MLAELTLSLFHTTKTSLKLVPLELTYTTPALLFSLLETFQTIQSGFLKCSSLVFQKTEQPVEPNLHIKSVYFRLAPDTRKIKASLSQMDLFVLKPTSKLTPSPARLSFSTRRWNWIYSAFPAWWCTLRLLCHYGFPMLIKICVCFPSHLTWWGEKPVTGQY